MKRFAVILTLGVIGSWAVAEAPKDAVKKDLEQFQGKWVVVSRELDGRKVPADTIKPTTLTVQGDKYTVRMGDTTVERGTIKIDPAKKPKTIDATSTEGENRGKTYHGIYEIKGDTAKDCFARTGTERPNAFKTMPSSGWVLQEYKREKKP